MMKLLWILYGLLIMAFSACTSPPSESVVTPIFTPSFTPQHTPIAFTPTPSMTLSPVPTELAQVMYTPTPDPGAGDIAGYYDGLVITLDHVGQTIQILYGQGMLLRLGDEFNWEIVIEPVDMVTLNQKFTPEPGEQGVFIARRKGRAVMKAVGNPKCLNNNPPCSRPSVLFTLKIEVK